jgi:hypothetical protein
MLEQKQARGQTTFVGLLLEDAGVARATNRHEVTSVHSNIQ